MIDTYFLHNKMKEKGLEMGIETAKTQKLLYHLTELDNLDSILEYGLLPRKLILEHSIKFIDVADANIIDKRTDTYAKEVKMAECLTDLVVPPKCFQCIFVPSEEIKQIVTDKLEKHGINCPPPYVNVQPIWFERK